jgi:hypothetical protein
VMRVAVWNMAGRAGNWSALGELAADIAALTEARPAPEAITAIGHGSTKGRDFERGFATAVASPHHVEEVADATLTRYGRQLGVPFGSSRPGSWTATRVSVTDAGDVTAIALYGLMDEKSDASVHRSLSELAAVFDDKRYNRLLLLGGISTPGQAGKRGAGTLLATRSCWTGSAPTV